MIELLLLVAVLFVAMFCHELGHFIAVKIFGWKPKFVVTSIGFGVSYSCATEGNEWKICFVSFFGIIGIIPLILWTIFVDSESAVFPIIVFGCYSVLELLFRIKKFKKQKNEKWRGNKKCLS